MIRILLAGLLGFATPALAQDEDTFRFGNDVFAAGGSVTVDAAGADDVFAVGERIDLLAPIAGSAHLMGRRIAVNADVGGDAYAAGADVALAAPVTGDASLAGYDVAVGAAVGGDLRAAARHVRLGAPVAGYALLAAETVTIDAAIGGDAAIDADTLAFGPGARVAGRLVLSGDAAEVAVPSEVAPADRVERHPSAAPDASGDGAASPVLDRAPSWLSLAIGFVIGVAILAVLALVVALAAPRGVERLAVLAGERPFYTFWIGFLTLSALIGATFLAVATIIGIIVAPAIVILGLAFGFVGYLVAVYLVGRLIWRWADQLPPDTLGERALVALIGALAVSLIVFLPFLGWIAHIVLTLTGLGALSIAFFRPRFRD